jgi:hypothetical protein
MIGRHCTLNTLLGNRSELVGYWSGSARQMRLPVSPGRFALIDSVPAANNALRDFQQP